MSKNYLTKLPRSLKAVFTLNFVVFVIFGATPSVSVLTILSFTALILLVFLIFFGRRKLSIGLRVHELLFIAFVFYASVVTLINDPDVLLFFRNAAFMLVVPLFIWVKSSDSYLNNKLDFAFLLPCFQLIFIAKIIIFEKPQIQGLRLFLDDYNIADSAVIFLFCLGLISGQFFSRLLSVVILLMVLGFGIRLNSLIMISFLLFWIISRRKGGYILFIIVLLGSYVGTSMSLSNLFLIEKFLKYGSSYKVMEFEELFSQLDLNGLFFPHGLSYSFDLGVFGGSVYFSHFFVLYMLTCVGLVGLVLVAYVAYVLLASFYLAIKTEKSEIRWLIFSLLASLVPALSIQASYKSLTFVGFFYALTCVLYDKTIWRDKHHDH